jgi:hypothetical protein
MGGTFHLPTETDIDGRAIFGMRRGLGAFCPDPALTALGLGEPWDAGISFLDVLGMLAARATGERSDLLRVA